MRLDLDFPAGGVGEECGELRLKRIISAGKIITQLENAWRNFH
jgi:hypothetical protein